MSVTVMLLLGHVLEHGRRVDLMLALLLLLK
jgi:hypothetical protein